MKYLRGTEEMAIEFNEKPEVAARNRLLEAYDECLVDTDEGAAGQVRLSAAAPSQSSGDN